VAALAPSAIQELQKYSWPGNVRELQNSMERAVILAAGDIHARHLNLSLHAASQPEPPNVWSAFDFSGTLADVAGRAQAQAEKRKIEKTLKEQAGNKGRASEVLGVSYKTFLMKLKEYGIE